MTDKDVLKIACAALEDKLAERLLVLDISKISVSADYFVVVSGKNVPQIRALTDNVYDKLVESGIKPLRTEGKPESGWVLMDYSSVIIHVFSEEARDFYELERVWCDGIRVNTL